MNRGLLIGLRPANETQRYVVTTSLIGANLESAQEYDIERISFNNWLLRSWK